MGVFEKQIQDYLSICLHQKKLNEKSLKAYRIDLTQFDLFVSNEESPLSKSCLVAFISSLHDKYKPKTAKRKIASLRAYFNFLAFDGQLTENPLSKIRIAFQEPITLPKSLSLKVVQKVIRTVYNCGTISDTENQRKTGLRNIAILELLFATGIRVSELCSITTSDIDLQEGNVKIKGKGARERIVYITNKESLAALRAYKTAYKLEINSTKWFFINRLGNRLSEQSVRILISNLCKKANIHEKVTPHMFRHSFATLLLEEDVDIRCIQSILGHSSITTTQIYTHVSAKKQRAILIKKHPRNRISL